MTLREPHTENTEDKTRLNKNKRIAQSQKETRKRRKNMDVLVRTVKIQRNKLSSSQREKLERLFLEGKWLYNTALAHNQFDEKFRKSLNYTVEIKFPNGNIETRNLEVLGGQLQQGILSRMRDNLKGLAALKKKGTQSRKSQIHLRDELYPFSPVWQYTQNSGEQGKNYQYPWLDAC